MFTGNTDNRIGLEDESTQALYSASLSAAAVRRKNIVTLCLTGAVLLAAALFVLIPELMTAAPEPEEEPSLPAYLEGAVEYNGNYYSLVDEPMYWSEARKRCEEVNGHLAVITSEEEQDFIASLVEENGTSKHYWLGGTDEDSEGDWVWITGEPMTYKNWTKDQPNDADYVDPEHGQDYMHLQCNNPDNPDVYMKWNDICDAGVTYTAKKDYRLPPSYNDTQYFGYICEWEQGSLDSSDD